MVRAPGRRRGAGHLRPLIEAPTTGRASRDAYLTQVGRFIGWLARSKHGAEALADPHVRDWAVRDYKRHVNTAKRSAPASVNQALTAIDVFYRSLAAARPEVPREELAPGRPPSARRR